jgi:hypothetical protein
MLRRLKPKPRRLPRRRGIKGVVVSIDPDTGNWKPATGSPRDDPYMNPRYLGDDPWICRSFAVHLPFICRYF